MSDDGGVPVSVLHPTTGGMTAAVWSASGLAYLPGTRANAITGAGAVLGQSDAGITIWEGSGSRTVGQGNGFALNDLATVVVGLNVGPVRWDGDVASSLQHPGEGVGGLVPLGVNDAGTVVGVGVITSLDSRAVRWDGTVPALLPELGTGGAHGALAIDDAGRIAGYSSGTVGGVTGRYPVVWDNGTPALLATLPGVEPYGNAQAIDESGNVAGFLRTASGDDHAMLWTSAGELIDLGAALPGLKSYARGVNAAGIVSGVAYPLDADPDVDTPILVRWTVAPATIYTFDGFFAPLANPPAVNLMKAGKAVPVRFSLGGDFGMDVFDSGYPRVRPGICDPNAPRQEVRELVNAKVGGLSFEAATGRYTYLWKVDRSLVGSCVDLVLRLDDGQERSARFLIGH